MTTVESAIVITIVALCIFSCIFVEFKIVAELADFFVSIEESISREEQFYEKTRNIKNVFNIRRIFENREVLSVNKNGENTWDVYAESSENIRFIDQISSVLFNK